MNFLARLRRLTRFRLRTLFVLLTLVCVGGGWFLQRVRRQRAAVAWVREHNGTVEYDFEIARTAPLGPAWLRDSLGIDFFAQPVFIEFFGASDLEPLRNLPALQTLAIYQPRWKVPDPLAPLARLPRLIRLHISGGDLPLESLKHCVRLTSLTGDFIRLDSLEPLASCRDLELVSLSKTNLRSLAGVERWPKLEVLRVEGPVDDLAPLAALANLQVLNIRGSRLESAQLPAGCSGLVELRLTESPIRNLSSLSAFANLEILELTNTAVEDLGFLAGLENLAILNLEGTQVRDLTPLAGLKKLGSVYLMRTAVRDVTQLLNLPGLHHVNLKESDVSPADIAALRQALPLCTVEAD